MLIGIRDREGSVLRKARSVLRFTFTLMLLFAVASQFFVSVTITKSEEDEATSALTSAEDAIVSAYQAALGAEEAGANISRLLLPLSEAAELVSYADMAYRLRDFNQTIHLAELSKGVCAEIQRDAEGLRSSAVSERLQNMLLSMVAFFAGVPLVICGSFWSWCFFKKRHYQKALEMKPEVATDES